MRHAAEVDVGLRIVERLVRLEVARMRAVGVPAAQDNYRGLYLSEEEIDALLSVPSDDGHAARTDEFEAAREASHAQAQLRALTADAKGPLGRLIRLADLTPFEVGCLLLCLALDADLRFERLFAYVQDDVTKRSPRVELALRLLAAPAGRREARRAFSAEAPLRRLRLLTLHGEPG
ncbi:MAG: ATP-binding protein, partial [Acidobacteria bacterium]|nr:ATP-binding protein [Acidobacteriota bacterium]